MLTELELETLRALQFNPMPIVLPGVPASIADGLFDDSLGGMSVLQDWMLANQHPSRIYKTGTARVRSRIEALRKHYRFLVEAVMVSAREGYPSARRVLPRCGLVGSVYNTTYGRYMAELMPILGYRQAERRSSPIPGKWKRVALDPFVASPKGFRPLVYSVPSEWGTWPGPAPWAALHEVRSGP